MGTRKTIDFQLPIETQEVPACPGQAMLYAEVDDEKRMAEEKKRSAAR